MPNNTFPILIVTPVPGQPNYGYINPNPQQQGFGQVETNIFTFFNSVNYPFTTSFGTTGIIYGAVGNVTSALDVSDYNNFAIQPDVSGSGTSTFSVSSSVDGLNFIGEFSVAYISSTSASIYRLSPTPHRVHYLLATHSGSGNATGSLYMIAGQ